MKQYELNELGKDWVWQAESEAQATALYLEEFCGMKTIEEYEKLMEYIGRDARIEWREI